MADTINEIEATATTEVMTKDKLVDEHVSAEVKEKCHLKRKEMDVPSDEKENDTDLKKMKTVHNENKVSTQETENIVSTEETTSGKTTPEESTDTDNAKEQETTGINKDVKEDESFEVIEMPKDKEGEKETAVTSNEKEAHKETATEEAKKDNL